MQMIDIVLQEEDFVSGEEFVSLGREILRLKNTENYHDDWVTIRANYNGNDIVIQRNAQMVVDGSRERHLRVENPTTMVMNGEVIRHHGEHAYCTAHMRAVIARLRPPHPQHDSFLQGVEGVVEANSFEIHALWKANNDLGKDGLEWVSDNLGILPTIGTLGNRPIVLSLLTATVDGHKLLFIDYVSAVVDHEQIDAWLVKTLPQSAFVGNNRRPNRVDAANFHNVFADLRPKLVAA